MKKSLLCALVLVMSISLVVVFSLFSCTTTKSKIAFGSDRDGNNEIYIMNIDGSEQTNLTNSAAGDGFPSFSPDGSKITFVSRRDGNLEVYIMNADGSEQKRLTNNQAADGYPYFLP